MSYDRFPERLIEEKTARLEDLQRPSGVHSRPQGGYGRMSRYAKGKYGLSESCG